MYSNVDKLYRLDPYDTKSLDQNLFPGALQLLTDANNLENTLTDTNPFSARKPIQTNADKGACRISK